MDSKQLGLRLISTKKDGGGEAERSNLATASFRVYYSLRPGAVPFLWESKPGTPKSPGATASVSPVDAGAGLLPPISPPPSYQSSQLKKGRRRWRPSGSCPAVDELVRALLGALGIGRRSRRRRPARLASLS
ncbi:hypothetical protein BS78_01G034800 [Paspalum vaginatum]|nr:hypothetical protein BS78_01G034800 [Paspalum vaginatum]